MKRLGRGKARYVSTILSAHDGNEFERQRRKAEGLGKSAFARLLISQALEARAVQWVVTKTIRPEKYPELEHETYLAIEPETERETIAPGPFSDIDFEACIDATLPPGCVRIDGAVVELAAESARA